MASLFLMMLYADRYINTARTIIENYDGSVPLQHHLKQFFAASKKYGSRDRRAISHAVYCYYRPGKAMTSLPVTERLKAAIWLCTDDPSPWSDVLDSNWLNAPAGSTREKWQYLQSIYSFTPWDIFPWHAQLSEGIDREAFILSHLVQPDLYLRVRPGRHATVLDILRQHQIPFTLSEDTIAMPNGTRVDQLLQLNRDVVVQDLSSQKVGGLLHSLPMQRSWKVWDCCAASGGKSLLVQDTLKHIDLTVSDIRQSILVNLKKRFAEAGMQHYKALVTDLADDSAKLPGKDFDLVVCDAPCSGSGTWGRNPEQLYFFPEEKIAHYAQLQKKIVTRVIPALRKGGHLLYITCSVFAAENEDAVRYILAHSGLQLVESRLIEGYDQKADTMFAALFTAG